jgi:CHASE3 domain sensor protein
MVKKAKDEIEEAARQADQLTASLIKQGNDQLRLIVWLALGVIAVCFVIVLVMAKVV